MMMPPSRTPGNHLSPQEMADKIKDAESLGMNRDNGYRQLAAEGWLYTATQGGLGYFQNSVTPHVIAYVQYETIGVYTLAFSGADNERQAFETVDDLLVYFNDVRRCLEKLTFDDNRLDIDVSLS